MATDTLGLDFGRDKPFYVYLYRDPRPRKRLQPIYVGKGTAAQRRADVHWRSGTRNPILRRMFAKFRSLSLAPAIEIIAWFDDEADAFALERSLIARFGRRDLGSGTLANMTDGGDGGSGLVVTEAGRAGRRKTAEKQWADGSLRDAMRVSWDDPEKRALMFGACRSEAASEKRTAKSKVQWSDLDRRMAHAAKMRAYWADPERSGLHKESRKSPEYRALQSAAHLLNPAPGV